MKLIRFNRVHILLATALLSLILALTGCDSAQPLSSTTMPVSLFTTTTQSLTTTETVTNSQTTDSSTLTTLPLSTETLQTTTTAIITTTSQTTTSVSTTTTSTTSTQTTTTWGDFNEEQAISIASRYVPQEILAVAMIQTSYGAGSSGSLFWSVVYYDFSISKELLVAETDNEWIFMNDGPYGQLQINIDAMTGELIKKWASPLLQTGPL